jgi:hypothetical protein
VMWHASELPAHIEGGEGVGERRERYIAVLTPPGVVHPTTAAVALRGSVHCGAQRPREGLRSWCGSVTTKEA